MIHEWVRSLIEEANRLQIIEIMLVPGRKPKGAGVSTSFHMVPIKDISEVSQELVEQIVEETDRGHLGIGDTRWRVTSIPSEWGTSVVMRRVAHAFALQGYPGMEERLRMLLQEAMRDFGVHVICGPVGSGKSALLSALVRTLLEKGRTVVVLEDPPEFDYRPVFHFPGSLLLVRAGAESLRDPFYRQSLLRMMDAVDIVVGEAHPENYEDLFHVAETGKRVWFTTHAVDTQRLLFRLFPLGSLRSLMVTRLVVQDDRTLPLIGLLWLPELMHVGNDLDHMHRLWQETRDYPISRALRFHALDLLEKGLLDEATLYHVGIQEPKNLVQGVHALNLSLGVMHATLEEHDLAEAISEFVGQPLPMTLTADIHWDEDRPLLEHWYPESFYGIRSANYALWVNIEKALYPRILDFYKQTQGKPTRLALALPRIES